MRNLYYIIAGLVIALIPYGIFLYATVHYGTATSTSLQPFELATVTALLGGFALAGGFANNARLVNLSYTLRRIGAIYIVSTVAFFIFGLFLPLTEKSLPDTLKSQATWVVTIGIYAGIACFTYASAWLLLIAIPKMFRER